MAEHQRSDQQRPRRQGGQHRRHNNNRRNQDDGPRTEHETYRREGSTTDYTPPRETRKTTFGGGEYERVYRDKPVPKKPFGKRILSLLSFGLLGKEKPAASKTAPNSKQQPKKNDRGPRGDRERDRDRGDRRGPRQERGEGRGPRPERAERNDRPRERRSDQGNTQTGPREPKQKTERPVQPVNLDAITTARLHVGNLSYDTAESDLFELFNGIGKVTNAEIVTHSRTQRSKGFGFVQLTSVEDAKRAASELHGKPFMGRVLMVGPANGNKSERSNDSNALDRREAQSETPAPAAE